MGRVGFASVTFRRIGSREEIIKIAKKAGTDLIEWGGDVHVKTLSDAREAYKICSANGVRIGSYGSYYRVGSFERKKRREACEIAAEMRAGTLRVWLGGAGSRKTSGEERKRLLDDARELCSVAGEYGLIVAPERHGGTYNDDTDAFLGFAGDLDKDNFKTYFQSRYRSLERDLDGMERTFPFIEKVHISFSERVREQAFGKKDGKYIDKLLDKLNSLGYKGDFILEFTYFSSPRFFMSDVKKLKEKVGERI